MIDYLLKAVRNHGFSVSDIARDDLDELISQKLVHVENMNVYCSAKGFVWLQRHGYWNEDKTAVKVIKNQLSFKEWYTRFKMYKIRGLYSSQ